jgi:hypothetical protein
MNSDYVRKITSIFVESNAVKHNFAVNENKNGKIQLAQRIPKLNPIIAMRKAGSSVA